MPTERRTDPAFHPRRAKSRRRNVNPAYWIFGLHAVEAALRNPERVKHRLVLTKNSAVRLAPVLDVCGMHADIVDAKNFPKVLHPASVHQGAVLEVDPLRQKSLDQLCFDSGNATRVVLLDKVSDPHNVGAVLRNAHAFGAAAVIATQRHAPSETGALAKSASGALEHVPYLRIKNLAAAMSSLQEESFSIIGFDCGAETDLQNLDEQFTYGRTGLVFGSEGSGLRNLTRRRCDILCRIGTRSLNVSTAAAIALFMLRTRSAAPS